MQYCKYLQVTENQRKIDREYKVFNNIWAKHYFFIDVSPSADSGDTNSVYKAFNLKGHFYAKHGGYCINLSFQL
jgi:hypothetical protein